MTVSPEAHDEAQFVGNHELEPPPLPTMNRWPLADAVLVNPNRKIAYEGSQGLVITTSYKDRHGPLVFSPITATLEAYHATSPQVDGQVGILLSPPDSSYAVRLQFTLEEPLGGPL